MYVLTPIPRFSFQANTGGDTGAALGGNTGGGRWPDTGGVPVAQVRPRDESAFTRYFFTSKLYCGSQSSFYCHLPPAKPTLLQYYCTTIAQHTPPTDPCYTPYSIGDGNIV